MLWKNKISLLTGCWLLAAALGFSGCPGGGDSSDDQTSADAGRSAARARNNAGAQDKTATDQKTEGDEEKEWRYDPANKWDPFSQPAPPVTPIAELQARYDLDQMALMGIVRGGGMDGAYIRYPDGTDRIIRVGDVLGKHKGEVKEIGEDYIIVEEKYLSPEQPNDTFIIEKIMTLVGTEKR